MRRWRVAQRKNVPDAAKSCRRSPIFFDDLSTMSRTSSVVTVAIRRREVLE